MIALRCGLTLFAVTLAVGCATEEGAQKTVVESRPDQGWSMLTAPSLPTFEMSEPFVKLVDLAKLRVGMTKDEVRAIFPDPLEVELQRDDEVWYYAFAQLIFRGDYLRDWFNR